MRKFLFVQTNSEGRPCAWGQSPDFALAKQEAERQWQCHGDCGRGACYPGEERGALQVTIFDDERKVATLTARQLALYEELLASGGEFCWGADVRVARRLERFGLVTIEDNGAMITVHGRTDGERWMVTPIRFENPGKVDDAVRDR
jgi:hypothetical protein